MPESRDNNILINGSINRKTTSDKSSRSSSPSHSITEQRPRSRSPPVERRPQSKSPEVRARRFKAPSRHRSNERRNYSRSTKRPESVIRRPWTANANHQQQNQSNHENQASN